MGGNIPGGNFLGENFPGEGEFPGGNLMGGKFSGWVCITASGNILASGNLCFRVFKLQLKVINKNVCYFHFH